MKVITAQDITNDFERDSTNKPETRKRLIELKLGPYVEQLEFDILSPDTLIKKYPLIQCITSSIFLDFLYNSHAHFEMFRDIDLLSTDGSGLIPLNIQRNKPHSTQIINIPKHLRCGLYAKDLMTPIYNNTYEHVINSIQTTHMAAYSALNNRVAYALVDSPGHHASFEEYGGYCFLNNAVYGAVCLQHIDSYTGKNKVAILDIDYHCGDGTSALCRKMEIPNISIHMNPIYDYPKHVGYEHENDKYTTNILVDPGTNIGKYTKKLEEALGHLKRICPNYVVISIGYDILKNDPDANSLGGMNILPGDFEVIAKTLSSGLYKINENVKVLIVQEGGYNLDLIPDATYHFVHNFKLESEE